MGSCVFCSVATGEIPGTIVLDEPEIVGFLDLSPVFHGHVLVAPRLHVDTLLELPGDLMQPLFGAAQRLARSVESPEGLGADGSFVAINNRVSQSVAHLHVHVVPRHRKDGLRGFFWPRQNYRDDAHREEVGQRLRSGLAAGSPH